MDSEGNRLIPISDEEQDFAGGDLVALGEENGSGIDWDSFDANDGVAVVEVAEPVEAVAIVPAEFVEAVVAAVPARAMVVEETAGNVVALDAGDAQAKAELEAMERVRIAAQARYGEGLVATGKGELARGDFEGAIRSFRNAIDAFGDRPMNASLRREAEKNLAEAYYQNALFLRQEGKMDAARDMAISARQAGHPRGERLVRSVDADIKTPPPPPTPPREPLRKQENFIAGQDRVEFLMSKAREFYSSGEYGLCRQQLELVLRDFPFETTAIDMLRRLENRRFDVATSEADATRDYMIAQVRDTWTPRMYAVNDTEEKRVAITTNRPDRGLEMDAGAMKERMRSIIIPEINFRQANLTDVITFLADASREYDPRQEIPVDRRGINLILSLQSGVATPPAGAGRNDDPFAAPAAGGMDSSPGARPITISARYISLMDALDLVMKLADLKYTVRGNIVTVVPANAPDSDLYHRMYNVLPAIADRMTSMRPTTTATDDWGAGASTRMGVTDLTDQRDWKAFFRELGVSWPIGSSIQYMSNIGKLVVMNTADNLSTLETVLGVLNVTPKQIEIEARFIEVEEGDMESLGFEWILNSTEFGRQGNVWQGSTRRRQIGTDDAGNPIYAEGVRNYVNVVGNDRFSRGDPNSQLYPPSGSHWEPVLGPPGPVDSAVPWLGPDGRPARVLEGSRNGSGLTQGFNYLTDVGGALLNNTLALSGIVANGFDISMILHALSSKQGTDMLSAPKVVTQTGSEATIKVVREYIYPTEYTSDPVMSSGGDSSASVQVGAVVTPGGFAMREVGVILQVIPEVTPDGQMINLTMAPAVVGEPTWEEYGSRIPMYDANGNVVLDPITGYPIYSVISMRQPIFPVRSISTKIQIYNGATVIMGGMITEKRITNEDKIPFLGDIPFIGRLFRNSYEVSTKRNLLIFVTAKLVDPAGRVVNDQPDLSSMMGAPQK